MCRDLAAEKQVKVGRNDGRKHSFSYLSTLVVVLLCVHVSCFLLILTLIFIDRCSDEFATRPLFVPLPHFLSAKDGASLRLLYVHMYEIHLEIVTTRIRFELNSPFLEKQVYTCAYSRRSVTTSKRTGARGNAMITRGGFQNDSHAALMGTSEMP